MPPSKSWKTQAMKCSSLPRPAPVVRIMESLIESGMISAVLDITTTEWADELVGGVLNAGPTRLDAAGKAGVPAIVTPGCLDMVNFGEPATDPGAVCRPHLSTTTTRRSPSCAPRPRSARNWAESSLERSNAYTGPVTVLLPLKAISIISAPGQPFHDPAADEALFASIKQHLRPGIPLVELDCDQRP